VATSSLHQNQANELANPLLHELHASSQGRNVKLPLKIDRALLTANLYIVISSDLE
jgi:hypothetical protein